MDSTGLYTRMDRQGINGTNLLYHTAKKVAQWLSRNKEEDRSFQEVFQTSLRPSKPKANTPPPVMHKRVL